ncbi:RNA polymerase sigma factor [Kribbella speibonae]|uniref:Sigma-70 family RNA polymerase sigma factor n=1 Tax=Kribbella speibonae TaxID=1572660 RepID=A0A4R0J3I7_9ACTN|nr:sigma-70 family RNA polymerase sigma factor [Kribbella speibonae]TCC27346.1 sigma-70 family RNA polymerase sigma factor [Kribbella speibonae]TCC35795.1 sigma-70 family RNA polymerase sigma factor [Kribbella speibonae]
MEEEVSPVAALVAAAADGDQQAWSELVSRYAPLLVSVIRQFRLTQSETEDVAQTVWLRLVGHLDSLQEPRAMPGWIITTARREALRYLSSGRRLRPDDPLDPAFQAIAADLEEPEEGLFRAERHEALLAGLAELPHRQRDLLLLLLEDPRPSYAEITERTGIPAGSIGPTRSRALERLRRSPRVRAYVESAERSEPSGGDHHDAATLG